MVADGIERFTPAVFDYADEAWSQPPRLNGFGFRDIDRSPGKPHSIYRIAVVRDSSIEAPLVAMAERVTEQLESESKRRAALAPRRVEVPTLGFSAHGAMQELQVFKQDVWRFHPDLVILAVLTGNDVRNDWRELLDEEGRPSLAIRTAAFQESFPHPPGPFATAAGGAPERTGAPRNRPADRDCLAATLMHVPSTIG